jgi:hypothetical protein
MAGQFFNYGSEALTTEVYKVFKQCCGSGSGIRCLFSLNPGSGMGKKSRSGSGMNNPDHISESLKTIVWVKIFLMRILDLESF